MSAMAQEAGVLRKTLEALREDDDRVLVPSEVGEPPAEPNPRVRIARGTVESRARTREVTLELGANVSRYRRRDQGLAEKRCRFWWCLNGANDDGEGRRHECHTHVEL